MTPHQKRLKNQRKKARQAKKRRNQTILRHSLLGLLCTLLIGAGAGVATHWPKKPLTLPKPYIAHPPIYASQEPAEAKPPRSSTPAACVPDAPATRKIRKASGAAAALAGRKATFARSLTGT